MSTFRFVLCLFLFATIPATTFSQTTFQRLFGGEDAEFGEVVLQTGDGGYLIAGQTTSGAPDLDLLLIKTDSNGVIEWSHAIGGSKEDRSYHGILLSPDTVLLVGSTQSYGSGSADVWLLEVTTQGSIVWSKAYGGVASEVGMFVDQTPEGDLIIAGHAGSPQNVLLLRTDRNGELRWARRYGGSNTDVGMAVTPTPEGGFLVAGWTWNWGYGMHDVLLLKTDSIGVLEWARTYGTYGDEGAHRVLPADDGGYVILGNSLDVPGLFFLKVRSDGLLQWAKGYQDIGQQIVSSLSPTIDGGFVMSGSAGIYGKQIGYSYLLRTDGEGLPSWCWLFPFSKADLREHDARQTADGGFITASDIYRLSQDKPDILLVKTDSTGRSGKYNQQLYFPVTKVLSMYVSTPPIPIYRTFLTTTEVVPRVREVIVPEEDVGSLTLVAGGLPLPQSIELENYPNPFNPSTNIRISLPSSGWVSLKVYDLLGREVSVLIDGYRPAGASNVHFDAGGLAGGVYLCRLDAEGATLIKKMILLR